MGFVQIHDQGRHFLLDIQGRSEQMTPDWLDSDITSAHSIVHYAQQKRPIAFIRMRMVHPEAVAQLVEALRYKPEGRGFESRCVTGIFH